MKSKIEKAIELFRQILSYLEKHPEGIVNVKSIIRDGTYVSSENIGTEYEIVVSGILIVLMNKNKHGTFTIYDKGNKFVQLYVFSHTDKTIELFAQLDKIYENILSSKSDKTFNDGADQLIHLIQKGETE